MDTLDKPGRSAVLDNAPPGERRRLMRDRERVVASLVDDLAADSPPNDPSAQMPHGVSVVVPSFRGVGHLGGCLRSLAAQTLDPSLFEVIVVLNGPPDGSRELIDAFTAQHPKVDVLVVDLADRTGVGLARNAGISLAGRRFISLLDDDDTVSPRYLEALLDHARWDVVPLAALVDVAPDGSQDDDTPFNRVLDKHAGRIVDANQAASLLSLNACKVLPTDLVQEVGYDVDLKSGVDVEFMVSLYAAGRFRLHPLPREEGAVYYRSLRPGSVSRREYDFAFSVEGRLDVIERVAQHALSRHRGTAAVAQALATAQAGFMRRYLEAAPDKREQVLAAIRRRRLPWFPYAALNRGASRRLVVSYCFTPYAVTSAVESAKRVHDRGEIVDVVTNAVDDVFAIDRGSQRIAEEFVDRTVVLETPALFGAWSAVREFCEASESAIASVVERKGEEYASMHSRAPWPASHFAAALYKIRSPRTRWSAEFSEPLSRDAQGALRSSDVGDDTVAQRLRAAMPADFVGDGLTMFQWCEQISYHLADELVFTSPNQLQVMLEDCTPEVREVVRRKAVIAPPAALPHRFYELAPVEQVSDDSRTCIAYFGALHPAGGLGEVLQALEQLTPDQRDNLRLDVFTGSDDTDDTDGLPVAGQPGEDVVRVHPYPPYLEFLALTAQYDALLVNDAETAGTHAANPYLPATYSDYRGSQRPVWGHVEPGSPLDGEDLQYRSTVGDVASARAVLQQLSEHTR